MDISKDELVSQISKSNDQNFYLITSPICNHSGTKNSPSLSDVSSECSKDSSLMSTSCCGKYCDELSPTRSRFNLERRKRLLLDQILLIEEELKILSNEEALLSDLQISIKNICSIIFKGKQNNLCVDHLREIMQNFDQSLANISSEIESMSSLPHADVIQANIHDTRKCLSDTLKKKSAPEVTTLMEMLCCVGELNGEAKTVVSLYYQNVFLEESYSNGENAWEAQTTAIIEKKGEVNDPLQNTDYENESLNSTSDSIIVSSSPLKKSLSKCSPQASPLKIFKFVLKSCAQIVSMMKSVERLSSGNPKMKSLKCCLAKTIEIIEKILQQDLNATANLKMINKLNKMKTVAQVERPTQSTLEEIMYTVSEFKGSVQILRKNYLQHKTGIPNEFFPERTATM